MRKLVIYHADCADGFCAAWVARGVLGDAAEYVPAHYGQNPPDVLAGAMVYILDFSYPRDVMIQIAKEARLVLVRDHHKTAMAALDGLDELPNVDCLFDMD